MHLNKYDRLLDMQKLKLHEEMMENVTIRCCLCDKEIFYAMGETAQRYITVYEANNSKCSDCLMAECLSNQKE